MDPGFGDCSLVFGQRIRGLQGVDAWDLKSK